MATKTVSKPGRECICRCGAAVKRSNQKYATPLCRHKWPPLIRVEGGLMWVASPTRWVARVTGVNRNPKHSNPFALEFLKTIKGEYRIIEPGVYWFGDTQDREWLLVNEDFSTTATNCTYAEVYGGELEARKPAERVWVPELEMWIIVDPAMDHYETRAL
jgi:hypothetical protein